MRPPASDLGFDAAALGVAGALGAAAIGASRPRRSTSRTVDGSTPSRDPFRTLRTLHTGRIGDSAAWITGGTAAIGAALAVGLR